MRKKKNQASRIEKCAHLLISQPDVLRGKWLQTFGSKELCLEIGCGKGRFAAEMAKTSPGTLFVALEKSANVIVAALERAAQDELTNVRFINALADNLPDYFAPNEVSRIYLNFPDPWPANRHKKRRLTGGKYLELYKQILRPGGEICLKTDNLPLFEFALGEFEALGFMLLEKTYNLHEKGPAGIMTEYETKFYSQGLPICWCRAKAKSVCYE